LVQNGQAQTLDGIAVAGGRQWALRAPRLEVGALLAVAALDDDVSPGLRRWIRNASPHAVLEDLAFTTYGDGRARFSAHLRDLGFAVVDAQPGLRGLGGALQGDERGLVFRPDPDAPLVFDWPAGFGVP